MSAGPRHGGTSLDFRRADCRGALIADQVTQRLALANRSTATPQLPRKKAQSGWIEAVLRPLLAAVGRPHGGKEGQRKGKAEATSMQVTSLDLHNGSRALVQAHWRTMWDLPVSITRRCQQ